MRTNGDRSGSDAHIEALRRRTEELERDFGITSIRLFGSRARGDFNADSDLDLLIEAERPYRFDLLGLIALEQDLSDELGVKVDLVLASDLKPHIAERVLAEAIAL